jgi:hypothetical protein
VFGGIGYKVWFNSYLNHSQYEYELQLTLLSHFLLATHQPISPQTKTLLLIDGENF